MRGALNGAGPRPWKLSLFVFGHTISPWVQSFFKNLGIPPQNKKAFVPRGLPARPARRHVFSKTCGREVGCNAGRYAMMRSERATRPLSVFLFLFGPGMARRPRVMIPDYRSRMKPVQTPPHTHAATANAANLRGARRSYGDTAPPLSSARAGHGSKVMPWGDRRVCPPIHIADPGTQRGFRPSSVEHQLSVGPR